MSKKKISSQDFMNLLDDQEALAERPAFKPAQPKRAKTKKNSEGTTASSTAKGFTLSPIQREWLNLALSRTPKVVTRAVTSDRAVQFLERVYASMDDVLTAMHRARASRESK